MEGETVRFQRLGGLGHQRGDRIGVADLVVQPDPHTLHGKVGLKIIRRGREEHALAAEAAFQKLGLGRPVAGDRNLHTKPRDPAESPQQPGFQRARRSEAAGKRGGVLAARHLVIGPGEAAGAVQEEMIEGIADAATDAAVIDDRLAIGHLADRGRRNGLAALDRVRHHHVGVREADIALDAQHHARRQHVIVSALQSQHVAAGAGHEIEIERKVEPAVQGGPAGPERRRRPVRGAPQRTGMRADIPACPIIGRRWGGHGRLGREVRRERRMSEAEHRAKPDADDQWRTAAVVGAPPDPRPCHDFTGLVRHDPRQYRPEEGGRRLHDDSPGVDRTQARFTPTGFAIARSLPRAIVRWHRQVTRVQHSARTGRACRQFLDRGWLSDGPQPVRQPRRPAEVRIRQFGEGFVKCRAAPPGRANNRPRFCEAQNHRSPSCRGAAGRERKRGQLVTTNACTAAAVAVVLNVCWQHRSNRMKGSGIA